MNRSQSKIRHIQESNILLEQRRLGLMGSQFTRINEESCMIGSIPKEVESITINGNLGKQDCSDWKWKSMEDPYLLVGYLVNSGNGQPGIICTIPHFNTYGANTVGNNLNEFDNIDLFKEIGTIMGYVSNDGTLNKQVSKTGKVFEWTTNGDESDLISKLNSLSNVKFPWTPS